MSKNRTVSSFWDRHCCVSLQNVQIYKSSELGSLTLLSQIAATDATRHRSANRDEEVTFALEDARELSSVEEADRLPDEPLRREHAIKTVYQVTNRISERTNGRTEPLSESVPNK